METIDLKISLPVDIYNSLKNMVHGNNINQIIVETLSNNISNDKQTLNELLIEGYSTSKDEDRQIMNDFSSSDLENWD